LSNRKRLFALLAPVALIAVGIGGVMAGHQAPRVDAAGPTHAAIGCANSIAATDISFPATAGVLTTSVQSVVTAGTVPALLSVTSPNSVVECGAVFEDDAAVVGAGTPAPAGQDLDPTTVDGGSITFTLNGGTTSAISTILEANSAVFTVGCGSTTTLESCQGAVPNTAAPAAATAVSPNPANIVHVALRPGATFGLIGAGSPVVTISATYNRFPSVTALAGVVGPSTATTNSVTIGLAVPTYASQLTPNPATIPAAAATGQGSTLTMALFHLTAICTAVGGNVILTPLTATGLVVCGNGINNVQQFTAGAESGVVTFSTSSGVFGSTALSQGGGQQIFSVHCGAIPATVPTILVPALGLASTFALTSCVTATATLFGGGAAGTAVVVANFVGDFTGATTQATTTVQLSAAPLTTALSRGCNEVITGPSVAANTPFATIAGLVTPGGQVVSIWMFNNSLHAFQAGYFSTAGAPTDISTVGPNQSLFICVSGAATFPTQ
jgi:hypothetical protein